MPAFGKLYTRGVSFCSMHHHLCQLDQAKGRRKDQSSSDLLLTTRHTHTGQPTQHHPQGRRKGQQPRHRDRRPSPATTGRLPQDQQAGQDPHLRGRRRLHPQRVHCHCHLPYVHCLLTHTSHSPVTCPDEQLLHFKQLSLTE
jgi:hypothetical protein